MVEAASEMCEENLRRSALENDETYVHFDEQFPSMYVPRRRLIISEQVRK